MANICRICMMSMTKLFSLVEETVKDKFTISTNGKYFEKYLGIKVEALPDYRKICTKCKSQLLNFHAFKMQAVEHHKVLLKLYDDTQFKKESKDTTVVKEKTVRQYTNRTKRHESSGITKIPEKTISNSNTTKILYNEDNSSENENKISVRNLSEAGESEIPIETNLSANEKENFSLNNDLLEMKIEIQDFDFINVDSSEYLSEDDKNSKFSRDTSQEKDVENEELNLISKKIGDSNIGRYFCTICKRSCRNERSYEAHQNVHKGLPPYSCKQCDKSFTKKRGIDYHLKLHNNIRAFTCDVCGKKYITNGDLKIHKQFHDETKFVVCHICGLKCKNKHNLKRHLDSHETTKKYECSICLKKCKTKYTLREHMDTIHLRKKEYLCPICGKVVYRNNVKKHLKVHQKDKGR